jgi:hypothetical protein
VETGLRFYLSALKLDCGRHIRALGEIVALLAQRIESKTGEHWNKDVFTGEALRRGIDVLVSHFAPGGTPVTPTRVKEAAAKMVGDAGEAYRSPIGLGETEAGHVMAWVEISNLRDFQEIGMVDAELRKKGGCLRGHGGQPVSGCVVPPPAAICRPQARRKTSSGEMTVIDAEPPPRILVVRSKNL